MIKWGAEISCKGRPDWLKDDDVCAVKCGSYFGNMSARADEWLWSSVNALKLRADHPYYSAIASVKNLANSIEIHQAIATLEAAGYTVTRLQCCAAPSLIPRRLIWRRLQMVSD
jgi:hypothetical protein